MNAVLSVCDSGYGVENEPFEKPPMMGSRPASCARAADKKHAQHVDVFHLAVLGEGWKNQRLSTIK
jgi:hypothetical protein